ncbi:alpha/beta hydrolase family protein [Hymenobacter volaticus]|uniref:Alpha/beta hydrolase family protein n=1 Tax=Hymenobacter volaticus TaxID=2932254 RepID=A0ABY4GDC8_9BACT|nr:acetylxylan esterase [Hymenobacter volaticus]UOQ68925.1 alpha/beta hydrolase family protein [Hymenobacter volaticus]
MRHWLLFVLLLGACWPVKGQVNSAALAWKNNTAYNSYLMRTVHQQYADRLMEVREAVSSQKAMLRYQQTRRARYQGILGDLPPKMALNARVVGSLAQAEFRVERIMFESAPHRYVTGNLYVPAGQGPFPVVLSLSGHGMNGKVSDQRVGILFASHGIAVFAVDPVAQGERLQLTDRNGNALTRGATTEHTLLNAGANLVGTSVAAYEYYDNTRALDYLETRPDLDKNKMGCIGSSGGGTQTTYLIALDQRIKAATVCSYVSRRERVLELSGPSDGCQHIPNEGREHLEISDFLTLFAPKPLLIMSGLYDFVDYWGATQAYDELKKVYHVFKADQQVSLFTAETGHGMPQPKREAAITWFRTWLCKDATPVLETAAAAIPEKELLCTSTGQISTAFPEAVSMPQYHQALAQGYAAQRAAFIRQDRAAVTQQVRALLGIMTPQAKIRVEGTGTVAARTYTLSKYQLNRAGEMPVPCVVLAPENVTPTATVVLYLNAAGKENILADEPTLNAFLNRGDLLVLADLRGFGETTDPAELNDLKYWTKEYRNAMLGLHIGAPVMGQRVLDIESLLDFITTDPNLKGHPVKLIANGLYGPAAVHAAYLDQRISSTEISRSVKSFQQLLQNPMQNDAYSNVLYGVLKYYDLQDLIEKAGSGKIRFVD